MGGGKTIYTVNKGLLGDGSWPDDAAWISLRAFFPFSSLFLYSAGLVSPTSLPLLEQAGGELTNERILLV